MEITRVTAEVRETPMVPRYRWREGLATSGASQTVAVLAIETADGTVATSRIPKGRTSAILIEDVIAPVLVGQDALMGERIWHLLHEADRTNHFPAYFLGPIDVALWDLKAKAAGLPLYKLIGGFRDTVPAYASTVTYGSVDEYLRIADLCLARGFRAIKLHAWGDVRRDGELALALRAHVGDDIDLMFDASGAHDLADAIRLARILEDAGFAWLEEPMREWGVEPYRRLGSRVGIPILSGETSAGLHRNIADFIVNDAADIVRTGVHYKDGITGALRIAHLADSFGMRAEIHGGGLANLHLACAIPNTTYFEVIVAGDDATPRHPIASDGTIAPSDEPGIGEMIR